MSTPPVAASAPSVGQAVTSATVNMFGFEINIMATAIFLLVAGLLFMFWRIQRSSKLDFTDMITKDGTSVSLTKVLQLVGGITATWIMIKLTLTGGLTEAILGIYLAYVASIEGYSKFISAKYKYNEGSVRDRGYSSSYGGYNNSYDRYGSYDEPSYARSKRNLNKKPAAPDDLDADDEVKPPKEL